MRGWMDWMKQEIRMHGNDALVCLVAKKGVTFFVVRRLEATKRAIKDQRWYQG